MVELMKKNGDWDEEGAEDDDDEEAIVQQMQQQQEEQQKAPEDEMFKHTPEDAKLFEQFLQLGRRARESSEELVFDKRRAT